MNDEALEAALLRQPTQQTRPSAEIEEPDWADVHRELKRKTSPC